MQCGPILRIQGKKILWVDAGVLPIAAGALEPFGRATRMWSVFSFQSPVKRLIANATKSK